MIRAIGTVAFAAVVLFVLVAFLAPRGAVRGTAYVIDGDTIAIGKTRFNLKGVAAPASNEPGAWEATNWMQQFLAGRVVTCVPNGKRSRNRLVAICYIGRQDIGAAIIRAGFARDCPRHSGGRYRADEQAARRAENDMAEDYPLPHYCKVHGR